MLDSSGVLMKKIIFRICLFAVLATALIWGRVFYLQKSHFQDGEKFLSEKNYKLAIREYDTALHFYSPFSPLNDKASEKLWQIGEMFEQKGEYDWANMAYGSIRSSYYAARSFYTPGRKWIDRCDEKISDVNVKTLIAEGSIKPEEASAEKAKFMQVARIDTAPSVFWSILAVLAFFGWISSAVFTALKGFTKDGSFVGKKALYGGLSFLSFFAVWVLALLKA